MRLLRIVLAAVLLHGALAVPPAYACSCRPLAEAKRFERARAVFVGAPTDVRDEGDGVVASLSVGAVYKGDVGPSVDVTTEATTGACGIAFTPGVEYTVYVEPGSGPFVTTSCSGTAIGAEPVVRRSPLLRYAEPTPTTVLAAAEALPDEPPGRSGPIAASLMLMIVTLAGLAARWRRRAGP